MAIIIWAASLDLGDDENEQKNETDVIDALMRSKKIK